MYPKKTRDEKKGFSKGMPQSLGVWRKEADGEIGVGGVGVGGWELRL